MVEHVMGGISGNKKAEDNSNTGQTGTGNTGNDKTGGDKTGGTDDPNKKKTTDPGPDDGYEGGLIFIDHDLSGIDPHEGITVPGPDSQGKKNGEASSVMPVSPDDPGHVPEEMKDEDLLLTEEEAKAIKAAKEAGYTDPMPEESQ